jgi:2'-5' RNA ligase
MFLQTSGGGREDLTRRACTDRLFFAALPDASSAGGIEQLGQRLRAKHGLRGKSIARERLHVTLHHVGDYPGLPPALVAAARAVASAVALPPFIVEFNGAVSFRGRPGSRPFVLQGDEGVIGLMLLQQRLGRAMEKAGLGDCNLRYTPHMTLLYGDRLVPDHAVEPVRWPVHEFVLVHSLLGRSRHIPLARFPLRAQA